MKYVPNTLSIFRLFMIIPLIIFEPFSFMFMVAYVLACASDMLDGPIARKFEVTSQLGATLDGIADILLVIVVLIRVIPVIDIPTWIILWIVLAVAMKIASIVVGYIRHKQIISLHTYFGKAFIFILCLFPVFYLFLPASTILIPIIIFAMVVFAEEIYICATSTMPDPNDKGILFRKDTTKTEVPK